MGAGISAGGRRCCAGRGGQYRPMYALGRMRSGSIYGPSATFACQGMKFSVFFLLLPATPPASPVFRNGQGRFCFEQQLAKPLLELNLPLSPVSHPSPPMLTSRALAAALSVRFPDRAGDPAFLRRVLVIQGMNPDYTPGDMMARFSTFGVVLSSEVVQDDIGHRAGVIVFGTDAACSAAAEAEPSQGSYRTAAQATTLDAKNHRRSCRHLMDLIGVLDTVCPAATDDPEFLERSVLVEGVSPNTSPRDLLRAFISLPVQATVLVRDAELGDRVGLLVLADAAHCATATAAACSGCFCDCIQANRAGLNRLHILDALDNSARRQPTAEVFRSLIPSDYLLRDTEMDLHLRCVFLRGPGSSGPVAGGAYGLCCIGNEVLLTSGRLCAVIIRKVQSIGVLVYDDAQATEGVGARASLLRPGLVTSDSSLFPLPAAAGAVSASLARRLLPPFVTATDYAGRVILLDMEELAKVEACDPAEAFDPAEVCDAVGIAHLLEGELGLSHDLEAIIVHRILRAILLVLGSEEDAQVVLEVPQEVWVRAFRASGGQVRCHLLQATPRQQPPAPLQLQLSLNHFINPMAFEILRLIFKTRVEACHALDFRGITRQLVGLAALTQPHAIRRGYFPDRAVLLTGIAPDKRESDLRTALARYGPLDELVHSEYMGLALVIFTSWRGATRLLREPDETRLALGLGDCRPAPDAGFARSFVDYVLDSLLYYHGILPPLV